MPDDSPNNEQIGNGNNPPDNVVNLPGSVTEPNTIKEQNTDSNSVQTTPDTIPQENTIADTQTEEHKPSLAITDSGQPHKPHKLRKILSATLILAVLGSAAFTAWTFSKQGAENSQNANLSAIQEIEMLTVGNTEGPANSFFPDDQLQGVYFGLNRQIYEGLVGVTDRKITPLLAKSWTNPDEKTWIFNLKPNIKFHTGKSVTANEVKASLDDLKKYDYWSIFVSTIESVEVLNDEQIKITTSQPDALLLNRLSLAFITDLSAPDEAGNNGTGAYQVDESIANDDRNMTITAFDEYHGGRAKTRKVNYKIFENDEAIIEALKKGDIDIAETQQVPETIQQLTAEGYANTEIESPGAFGIYLNMKRSNNTLLQKKEIRQAIAEAIDREEIVKRVDQQHRPSTQVIPKSLPGYDAAIKMPEYSSEKAQATLSQAGYKNEPLEFFYIEGLQLDAPIIIEQLRAAGFNIRERKYQEATIPDMVAELRAGRFDMFTAVFSSDFIDARDLLGALLHSKESTYPVLVDEDYDKILGESDTAFDPAERTKKLQEANKYIADNFLWIPVRNAVYVAYYKPNLSISVDFYGGSNIGAYFYKVGRTTN